MPRPSPEKTRKATAPPPPPAPIRKKIPIETLELAIWDAYGIVTKAAERVGMGREALHRRISKSARLRTAVQSARERLVDAAEDGLVYSIEKREPWAIALALKTLGKSRGYVERQELDALFALVDKDPADMTDEELDQALARATTRRRS